MKRVAIIRLSVALILAALSTPSVAPAQSPFNQTGAFLGAWCAQGDPGRRASIASNGPFNVTLTNESGSTSSGLIGGPNARQITAPDWNLVQGTLSADGRTIDWSNNTFWSRCPHHHRYPDVEGTWYVSGDRSRACRIVQRKGTLTLTNESGQRGSGSFTGRRQISSTWSGTPITATVSPDGNRIDWSNGTYWTR